MATTGPARSPLAAGLLVRSEVRFDRSLNNTHPYNRGVDDGSFTLASEFVPTL
jgi:hypothetical protein